MYGVGRWLFIGGIFLVGACAVSLAQWDTNRRTPRRDRQARIDRLTDALKEAVGAIEAIQVEMEEGHQSLAELERRVEVSRELAKLSDPQAEAVRAILSDQLEDEGRRTFRRDIILGSVFFLLGLGASRILGAG
jgi:ABC-type multidrug transport system fused ATPase/permease subunit